MTFITLRLPSTWNERLLHRFDVVLERIEHMVRSWLVDQPRDLDQSIHAARIRRSVARGGSGQALI